MILKFPGGDEQRPGRSSDSVADAAPPAAPAASPVASPADSPESRRMEGAARRRRVAEIINSYDGWLNRVYSHARFRIIHQGFLDELLQFMPSHGKVLELGCGFGLFGLYFAKSCPGLSITGVDINERRIEMAQRAAARLNVQNARFVSGDARNVQLETDYDGIYMLDILHHLPPATVPTLLKQLHESLKPGGVLLIKDVDTQPRSKMAFTWALDVLMTAEVPHYWSSQALIGALRTVGFQVFCYSMVDILPYPHRLFFCLKGDLTHLTGA